ncbi:cobyrinate a,c-diamide synthase [Methylocystis sp. MJC1]|jgi:cobyrinic acid a,c-diamide synthase|uniref:cobyrinate a,c-diamide synthase n=1 Tax=Methylocystis sp. MJC1 TaxID=2654282 RepID=UPI0013EBF1F7|nr:cobyrinate a,c-diamide synthase [Methylocystis sp. MJC1]KAF2990978.1 Hydrogenobyrinate a,c-diamide synthase [Methylocystis sp. MJC1]MBU6527869.1 cobyrinate a,c-diamide synthase [Methylocystis sp. MJC1]UZX10790.1 cobyrinate a,c-diamide synthase [Methylocystis sp. MJC1]
MSAPGILIAAARSGSGKTTLALGLMRALTRRGMRVTAVKCGPDYIDPAFHAAATGHEGINLDSWAMEPGLIAALAAKAGAEADIIIAEGAMGLFDGAPEGAAGTGASADIAALLGWPVLLAHDASGQAQTAGAVIRGLASHDPRVKIAGVVANRLGSDRHRRLVAESVAALGLALFGALPRNDAVKLPERHLGLVQAGETEGLDARLNALADFVEAHVDVAAIVKAAASAPAVFDASAAPKPPAQRIAVARDAAFSFFYPHHAQSWRAQGAELVFFSPLADAPPPNDADLCWLPGGYPELHAGALAQAENFLSGLRRFAQTKPIHGECGGYMVLGRVLTDADGRAHRMAGLLELETSFASRKLHLGYRIATLAAEDHCLGPKGRVLRGHEFHYATVTREHGDAFALARDPYSSAQSPAGLRAGSVSGTFFHVIS